MVDIKVKVAEKKCFDFVFSSFQFKVAFKNVYLVMKILQLASTKDRKHDNGKSKKLHSVLFSKINSVRNK